MSQDRDTQLRELEEQIARLRNLSSQEGIDLKEVIETLENRRIKLYDKLDGWQKTQIARRPERPKAMHYIENLFTGFTPLAGDRLYGDDNALIGGPAWFEGLPVFVFGQEKGRDTEDRIRRNFGMAQPEGYRKARRLFRMAEKLGKPIITFVDTPGAYPGIGAEERGQAVAIAENLLELARLRVPVIVFVIGEGGSGGALALAIGDRVFMLEYSTYSVISPEGCASILFRDASKAPLAANMLNLTAQDLLRMEIIDAIIPEPLGGADRDPLQITASVREVLHQTLKDLIDLPTDQLLAERYDKFRRMGQHKIEESAG